MDAQETGDLLRERKRRGDPYLEFLRVRSLSCGLYEVPKGGTDAQSPHTEDEVYCVVRGRGRIRVGPEDRRVGPGSIVFVPALVEHRFHDIAKTLSVLVFFAPAEGTRGPDATKPT